MKNLIKIITSIALIASISSCGSQSNKVKLETQMDSVSYMIGMQIGANFATFPDKEGINVHAIAYAMEHMLEGKDTLFTMQEMGQYWQQYTMELQMKEQAKAGEEAEANLIKGQEFLEANKQKEGVVETESGLQYKVLTEGNGANPTATDKVKVHYHGTLMDGTVFDSSVDRGEPIEFPLNGVIPGWTEGVQLMSVGSKYEFYIPANLAYGAQPDPRGAIPPNATLIFQVELLDIVTE